MARGNQETDYYYFNDRQAVSTRLDYTLEWYQDLNANLLEPSTERTTENIAELQIQREVAQREMGMLATRLSELSDSTITDADLDEMLNSELEEVK